MRITLGAIVICILANIGLSAPLRAQPGFFGSPDQVMPPPSLFVSLGDQVAVLDPTTNEIRRIAPFPLTRFPMVASPTKPLLFVLDWNYQTQIYFINTNTIGLVGTVTTTSEITGMTLGDNGNILYAASGNQVLVISVQTRTIKAAITLPGSVFGVAVVGQGHKLYATLPDLHEFAVIDATTNTVRGFVPAGRCDHRSGHDPCSPRDIRTSPGGRYAIAVSGRNAIAVDTMTGTVLASPAAEGFLFHDYALALDPSTNELWINGPGFKQSQYTSINMLPPFNVVSSFAEFASSAPNSAAFTPSGQGYGSYFFRAERDKVTSFPPSQDGFRLRLGGYTGPIVYVP